MQFLIKKFFELHSEELYDILALRSEIFVLEQKCIYQDIDYRDKDAIHIIGYENKEIICYARILSPGTVYPKHTAIGRVLVREQYRKRQNGNTLMKKAIFVCQKEHSSYPIKISAQSHLDKFYSELNFKSTGKQYIEDGIPHQEMIYISTL